VTGDVPVDSEVLLVTDFINLKIKPTQSFGVAHRGRVCVRVFIGMSAHTCMSICVCSVFLKKKFDSLILGSCGSTKIENHGRPQLTLIRTFTMEIFHPDLI
jgi:hypothetical protein